MISGFLGLKFFMTVGRLILNSFLYTPCSRHRRGDCTFKKGRDPDAVFAPVMCGS